MRGLVSLPWQPDQNNTHFLKHLDLNSMMIYNTMGWIISNIDKIHVKTWIQSSHGIWKYYSSCIIGNTRFGLENFSSSNISWSPSYVKELFLRIVTYNPVLKYGLYNNYSVSTQRFHVFTTDNKCTLVNIQYAISRKISIALTNYLVYKETCNTISNVVFWLNKALPYQYFKLGWSALQENKAITIPKVRWSVLTQTCATERERCKRALTI